MQPMRFKKILKFLGEAAKECETVKIYYPATQSKEEGWREIEPYSLTTDLPPKGEYLDFDREHIRPGHILNAYNAGSQDQKCHSFILGKIKRIKKTNTNFEPRNDWKVRF